MRRTDSEDKTVVFKVSFPGTPGEEPAPSVCEFSSHEELVAGEPAKDNRYGTWPAPQQRQHGRDIYELLPQWMR